MHLCIGDVQYIAQTYHIKRVLERDLGHLLHLTFQNVESFELIDFWIEKVRLSALVRLNEPWPTVIILLTHAWTTEMIALFHILIWWGQLGRRYIMQGYKIELVILLWYTVDSWLCEGKILTREREREQRAESREWHVKRVNEAVGKGRHVMEQRSVQVVVAVTVGTFIEWTHVLSTSFINFACLCTFASFWKLGLSLHGGSDSYLLY